MENDDFRNIVRKMRAAQARYFKHRDRRDLADSLRIERLVDDELAEPSLFGPPKTSALDGLKFPTTAADPETVVASERERCARIVESFENTDPDRAIQAAAAAIRKGPTR